MRERAREREIGISSRPGGASRRERARAENGERECARYIQHVIVLAPSVHIVHGAVEHVPGPVSRIHIIMAHVLVVVHIGRVVGRWASEACVQSRAGRGRACKMLREGHHEERA